LHSYSSTNEFSFHFGVFETLAQKRFGLFLKEIEYRLSGIRHCNYGASWIANFISIFSRYSIGTYSQLGNFMANNISGNAKTSMSQKWKPRIKRVWYLLY